MPVQYDAAAQDQLPPTSLDTWWLLFDDVQLTALVERALSNGLDARLAFARLEEARAIRGRALSSFAPQGSLQGSADITGTENLDGQDPGSTRSVDVTFPVTWEIDLFGRRAATRKAADADLAAARFDYEAARAALVAQVAQTLFQARGLAAQLDDANASLRIQQDLLELLNRQVERGLTAQSQADRVAGDVARMQAQMLALQSELAAAKRSLLLLVGDGMAPIESMTISPDMYEAPSIPATVPADLMVRRPDIRQARERIENASGNVRLAELDFFPRLSFQPSLGLSMQRGSEKVSTGFWSLGVGASVPVLDRAMLLSALDIQSALGQQAVIGYEQAVQNAFVESDQALSRLVADRQRIAVLVDGQIRAKRAHDAARIRFTRGLGGLQEVLDAEVAWRATQTALTTARLDALQRSVQTFKALGGGWQTTSTSASAHSI
jgi:NodT family efflux transporter outer membrane factor (OMF) lipoprotein